MCTLYDAVMSSTGLLSHPPPITTLFLGYLIPNYVNRFINCYKVFAILRKKSNYKIGCRQFCLTPSCPSLKRLVS